MKHISDNKRAESVEFYSLDSTVNPAKVRVVRTVFEDVDVADLRLRIVELESFLTSLIVQEVVVPAGASAEVTEAIQNYNETVIPIALEHKRKAQEDLEVLTSKLTEMGL